MVEPTRLAFGRRLKEVASDHDFIVCNADTKACDLQNFGDKYPDRTITYGIAEQNLIAGAAGVATYGRKAVVSTYSNFIVMRALEQVRTYVCQPNLDVLMLASHCGLLTSIEGVSHTAIEDIAIMRAIPNISIFEPSDRVSARAMVDEILNLHGPVYVRLHYLSVPDVNDPSDYKFEVGKARVSIEVGNDVLICVAGTLLGKVCEASRRLEEEGIKVTVLEFPTIKPLDVEALLFFASRCGVVVAVEDHNILGGFGSSIAESLSELMPTPVLRMGVRDRFSESAPAEDLYKKHHLTVADIESTCRRAFLLKQG